LPIYACYLANRNLTHYHRQPISDYNYGVTVGSQGFVRCQEAQRFGKRLGDEHPVEWIATVSERQTA